LCIELVSIVSEPGGDEAENEQKASEEVTTTEQKEKIMDAAVKPSGKTAGRSKHSPWVMASKMVKEEGK